MPTKRVQSWKRHVPIIHQLLGPLNAIVSQGSGLIWEPVKEICEPRMLSGSPGCCCPSSLVHNYGMAECAFYSPSTRRKLQILIKFKFGKGFALLSRSLGWELQELQPLLKFKSATFSCWYPTLLCRTRAFSAQRLLSLNLAGAYCTGVCYFIHMLLAGHFSPCFLLVTFLGCSGLPLPTEIGHGRHTPFLPCSTVLKYACGVFLFLHMADHRHKRNGSLGLSSSHSDNGSGSSTASSLMALILIVWTSCPQLESLSSS